MKVLISPSEGALADALGDMAIVSSLPEQRGADVLLFSAWGVGGLQRKEVPHDFLSSIVDGRMARETSLLAECTKFKSVIAEGRFRYFSDGTVSTSAPRDVYARFNRTIIKKLIFDIKLVKGVDVDFTDDLEDTVRYIKALQEFLLAPKHIGLFTRPKAHGAWGTPTANEAWSWILQGFEGIGPGLADSIIQHFGTLPLKWDCEYGELLRIPKIGISRARKLWTTLPSSVI